jgi:hypothetical protein
MSTCVVQSNSTKHAVAFVQSSLSDLAGYQTFWHSHDKQCAMLASADDVNAMLASWLQTVRFLPCIPASFELGSSHKHVLPL